MKPTQQIIKKISKSFKFQLTHEDYVEKAKRVAAARAELDAANNEFAKAKQANKEAVETLGGEITSELRIIRNGEEWRDVECEEVHDYARAIVYWTFKGQIMAQRGMEIEERQLSLLPSAPVTSDDDNKAWGGNIGIHNVESEG